MQPVQTRSHNNVTGYRRWSLFYYRHRATLFLKYRARSKDCAQAAGPRRGGGAMPTRLDAIDRKILKELQDDGRITNVELSQRVGISSPPCLRRRVAPSA